VIVSLDKTLIHRL